MRPPTRKARYAVIDPSASDGAMYATQTNSYVWAWLYWKVFMLGDGRIVDLDKKTRKPS